MNYDKIICWEHRNICDEIITELENVRFYLKTKKAYPFWAI